MVNFFRPGSSVDRHRDVGLGLMILGQMLNLLVSVVRRKCSDFLRCVCSICLLNPRVLKSARYSRVPVRPQPTAVILSN